MDQVFGKDNTLVKPNTFTISQQNKNYVRSNESKP